VKVLGRLANAPEGKQGLVLSLIPPQFQSLAGPPSFQSVTRDVYPAPDNSSSSSHRFDMRTIGNILLGVSSFAAHYHAHSIAHGDLYGHNILVDFSLHGFPLLSDFGAATIYRRFEASKVDFTGYEQGEEEDKDKDHRSFDPLKAMQSIEVRAFGYLIEELLDNHVLAYSGSKDSLSSEEQSQFQHLTIIKSLCSEELPSHRPTFHAINSEIATIFQK